MKYALAVAALFLSAEAVAAAPRLAVPLIAYSAGTLSEYMFEAPYFGDAAPELCWTRDMKVAKCAYDDGIDREVRIQKTRVY